PGRLGRRRARLHLRWADGRARDPGLADRVRARRGRGRALGGAAAAGAAALGAWRDLRLPALRGDRLDAAAHLRRDRPAAAADADPDRLVDRALAGGALDLGGQPRAGGRVWRVAETCERGVTAPVWRLSERRGGCCGSGPSTRAWT